MGKIWKLILLVGLAIVLIFVVLIYVGFNGLPWKKYAIAKELQIYLEEKYEQQFVLKSRHYNFKDGTYFAYFYPADDKTLEFYAEEGFAEYEYIDIYPEVIWEKQLKEDITPIANEVYPDIDTIETSYLTYESIDFVTGPTIPRYDEIHSTTTAHFTVKQPFRNSDEEWEKISKLVIIIQNRSKNSDSTFTYVDKKKEVETFIICPPKADHVIKYKEDAKNHCEVSVFDLMDD